MGVRAIRFEHVGRTLAARREELSREELRRYAAGGVPSAVAYVVQAQDLESLLLELGDAVCDCGVKHQATQLSRLLLGRDRPAAIRASYRAGRSAKKSISALLRHAEAEGERRFFLIGTGEDIVERLWDGAKSPAGPLPSPLPSAARRFQAEREGAADELLRPAFQAPSSRVVHDALSSIEVPDDLCRFFLGTAPEVHRVRQSIMRAAADDDLPVLLLGESGTGKDLVAKAIHYYTRKRHEAEERPMGRFIRVNAGAISEHLLETELFGHGRGSFSGAEQDRRGLWRMADGGTLFLDEVADLIAAHQVKILRVIEDGMVRPVGSDAATRVTTRVIAATNKDLDQMVQKGMFRDDLFNRLRNAMTIRTPPLRDHPDDIRLIANQYWKRITRNDGAELPDDIVRALTAYRWPGNVRELEGVLMNLLIYFGDTGLRAEHLQKVFYMTGQPTQLQDDPTDHNLIETYQLDCFRHLRRVSQVVRAGKIALRPMSVESKTDLESVRQIETALSQHYHELDWLCRRPLLFFAESTFRAVHALKGRVQYFLSILRVAPDRALRYYHLELHEEFDQVLTELFKEAEALVKGERQRA